MAFFGALFGATQFSCSCTIDNAPGSLSFDENNFTVTRASQPQIYFWDQFSGVHWDPPTDPMNWTFASETFKIVMDEPRSCLHILNRLQQNRLEAILTQTNPFVGTVDGQRVFLGFSPAPANTIDFYFSENQTKIFKLSHLKCWEIPIELNDVPKGKQTFKFEFVSLTESINEKISFTSERFTISCVNYKLQHMIQEKVKLNAANKNSFFQWASSSS